jgi:hypothetical protein
VRVFAIGGQLDPFAFQIGMFRIGLGTHGDILSGGHRHGTSHQSGNTGDQNATTACLGSGHANDQAGRGEESIIGT